MRKLSIRDGIIAAIKADTLSMIAWQLLHGDRAVHYLPARFNARLETNSVEFWFMMQIGMILGFPTSYLVNWWLICCGIEEKM